MVKTANASSSSTSTEQPSEPKYTGVRKRKWGKWVSEIRLPNSRERIWLGSYDSPEKAARAFDAALYCLRGPGAKFNFPGNPPEIVGRESLSPQEIQAVAARFANETTASTSTTNTSTPESSSHYNNNSNFSCLSNSSTSDGAVYAMGSTVSDHSAGMDWSFLNALELGVSDFGCYPGFHNIAAGNEYYPPPPPSSIFYDDSGEFNEDDNDGNNGADYSHHSSFLWNF